MKLSHPGGTVTYVTRSDQATVDADAWQKVNDLVLAANAMDLAAFRVAYVALDDLDDFQVAAGYLYYLLWRRASFLIRKKEPSLDDIAKLADLVYSRWTQLVVADKVALEHTLRTVLGKSEFGAQVGGTFFAAYTSAALGVLLEDAEHELEEMRPYVASWYQRKFGAK